MLLLLDKMLKLFDFVMNEGGPVSVVWRMLGNLIPEYLSLGIPIGVMLGILLAFRSLALSSELDALRAVGMSYNRLLRVPLMFADRLRWRQFRHRRLLQPYSRYAYEGLRFELRSGALGASIKVGEFAKLAKGDDDAGRGEPRQGGRPARAVRPHRGQGRQVGRGHRRAGHVPVDRRSGRHPAAAEATARWSTTRTGFVAPRVLTFDQHDLPINLPAMGSFRKRGDQNLELTLPELAQRGARPRRIAREPSRTSPR